MANRKSIRSGSGKRAPRPGSIKSNVRTGGKSDADKGKGKRAEQVPDRLLCDLRSVALRLGQVSAAAKTSQMALLHQNCEGDEDVADCIGIWICDPLWDQVLCLWKIVRRLGGDVPEEFT